MVTVVETRIPENDRVYAALIAFAPAIGCVLWGCFHGWTLNPVGIVFELVFFGILFALPLAMVQFATTRAQLYGSAAGIAAVTGAVAIYAGVASNGWALLSVPFVGMVPPGAIAATAAYRQRGRVVLVQGAVHLLGLAISALLWLWLRTPQPASFLAVMASWSPVWIASVIAARIGRRARDSRPDSARVVGGPG